MSSDSEVTLGFADHIVGVAGAIYWEVSVPSFRHDVNQRLAVANQWITGKQKGVRLQGFEPIQVLLAATNVICKNIHRALLYFTLL